ncbi:MAG: transcriptional regulator [Chloroflexota bacterium]|nr:transcriptional regulator [Chloroflexota bacterium]
MQDTTEELSRQIAGIAVLDEPVRRNLYLYIVDRPLPVGRDEAAGALGISRALAAFHLDRLAQQGLLAVEYRRLTGRAGPGAGRPSKLYRRSDRKLQVMLPPRSYELAARLLARAVERAAAGSPSSDVAGAVVDPNVVSPGPLGQARAPADARVIEALHTTAHDFGTDMGRDARAALPTEPDPEELAEVAEQALAAYGYEPCLERGKAGQPISGIRLRNCPFHALAEEHRALVCGMNLSLLEGFVEGLKICTTSREPTEMTFEAILDPQPGMCCVRLRRESQA